MHNQASSEWLGRGASAHVLGLPFAHGASYRVAMRLSGFLTTSLLALSLAAPVMAATARETLIGAH